MQRTLGAAPMLLLLVAAAAPTVDFADQLARDVPKLAFLRKHDPGTFRRIAAIYDAGRRSGKSQGEMIGEARRIFAGEQQARLAAAPDGMVLRAFDNMLAVIRELEAVSPERCAALLGGGNAGDIKPYLSEGTIAREDSFYETVFTSARPAKVPSPATAEEEQMFVGKAVVEEARRAGMPTEAFVQAAFATPAGYCALQRRMLESERAAPNAAALFRRKLAAGKPG